MFYRNPENIYPENIYRVTQLDAFPWLVHGFGTRLADIPANPTKPPSKKKTKKSLPLLDEDQ